MKQYKYFCGPYVVETTEPLYVVWSKCHVGNGTFWQNETLDNDDLTSILAAKETLDCHEESYIEVFPLYEETFTRPSINQATFGVISVAAVADKGSDLERVGFYAIHADNGFISYRAPSVELDHKKSMELLNAITMLGRKPSFVVRGEEIELEKIKQVEDEGITWKFGDDIKLEYTAEQVELLKQYI